MYVIQHRHPICLPDTVLGDASVVLVDVDMDSMHATYEEQMMYTERSYVIQHIETCEVTSE